jgi:hypothetical protein
MKKTIKDAIDKHEVKRFVEVYLSSNKGKLEESSTLGFILGSAKPRFPIALKQGVGLPC